MIFLINKKGFCIYNVYLLNLNIVTMTLNYWSLHFSTALLSPYKVLNTFLNTMHKNWHMQVEVCTALLHVYCEIVSV